MSLTAMIDKVVQISDFKKNPSRFLDEVAAGTPITITRGRKADAILVPRETWSRLLARVQELEDELETRELLADPVVRERLRTGLPARGVPLGEARQRLRSRRRRR
ncbi:MAG: type II toxin-antitoxin system Phd/YefM family antitoxin [Armatimonadota bacterium]|nr:type II toxin-antitoxin system Phd/YefM family antitoxin [Armatimonadota bacterium]